MAPSLEKARSLIMISRDKSSRQTREAPHLAREERMPNRKSKSPLLAWKSLPGLSPPAEVTVQAVDQDAEKHLEPPQSEVHVGAILSSPGNATPRPVVENAGSVQPREAAEAQEQSARVTENEYGSRAARDDPLAPTSLVETHDRDMAQGNEVPNRELEQLLEMTLLYGEKERLPVLTEARRESDKLQLQSEGPGATIRSGNEKLGSDLSVPAVGVELHRCCDIVSRELALLRGELVKHIDHMFTSFAAQWREHHIIPVSDEVTRAKYQSNLAIEEQAMALADIEGFRTEPPEDPWKKSHKEQQEPSSVHDKIDLGGTDHQTPRKMSEEMDLDKLRRALEQKDKQIEELRKANAVLSGDVTSLNNQVDRLKGASIEKADQTLSDVREAKMTQKEGKGRSKTIRFPGFKMGSRKEKLHKAFSGSKQDQDSRRNSSVLISQCSDTQNHCDDQSREPASVDGGVDTGALSGESRDHVVAPTIDKLKEEKVASVSSAEQVVIMLEQDPSVSTSQQLEPQTYYDAESHKATPLPDELEECKHPDTSRAAEPATLGIWTETLEPSNTTTTEEIARLNAEDDQALLRAKESLRELERPEGRGDLEPQCGPNLLENSQSQIIEMQSKELKECQSQLDVLRRFTTTADLHTDTVITGMLQKLNAEVQQNTTFIAESISENSERSSETTTEEQESAIQRVSERIGQKLTDCLRGSDVAMYLPIAFQAYLSYHLCSIVSSWTNDKGNNDFIQAVYHRLQKKEAPMISGNWRILARTYISPTCSSDPQPFIASTITGLCDIVVAAGYAPSAPAAESMLSLFNDKVTSLIPIAGQLGKMIWEVVSSDFQVIFVRPNDMFEETTMEEDVDEPKGADSASAVGQKVLCSTCLGLVKWVSPESGGKNMMTVIKAKVLLESFLDG